jgi:hypothetical protein
LAFGLGYDIRHSRTALFLVTFPAAVEIVQLFVPGRHARLSDFLVDALAMTLGVWAADPIFGRDKNSASPLGTTPSQFALQQPRPAAAILVTETSQLLPHASRG